MTVAIIKSRFEKVYRFYRKVMWLVTTLREFRLVNPFTFVRMLCSGFSPKDYLMYDLDKNDKNLYLSSLNHAMAGSIRTQYEIYDHHKLLFNSLIEGKVITAKPIALIMKGKLVPLTSDRVSSISAIFEQAEKYRGLVIKPMQSQNGAGLFILTKPNDRWMVNNKEIDTTKLTSIVESLDDFYISTFIHQAEYSNQLFRPTTNTIRVRTLIDPDTGLAFIHAACHRMGTSKSFPADNVSQGGITAPIDIATGKMGTGKSITKKPFKITQFDIHPDTKSPINGATIPRWDEIKTAVIDMAQDLSFLQCIGWDVVLTDDGVAVIEGNFNSDITLHQLHSPVLTDPRTLRFYQYHRSVKRRVS